MSRSSWYWILAFALAIVGSAVLSFQEPGLDVVGLIGSGFLIGALESARASGRHQK